MVITDEEAKQFDGGEIESVESICPKCELKWVVVKGSVSKKGTIN
jgi:hypothetical protein